MKSHIATLLALLGLGLFSAAPVLAEGMGSGGDQGVEQAEEVGNAKETVAEAAAVMKQMDSDADARRLLRQAKAVFVVPDYARASFVAGAAAGQGVLISRTGDGWSGPAFYNIGAINFGAAAGVEAGSVVFVLMTDHALEGFKDVNNFSLNADAGLTVVDWSERAQASAGKGADVVVWSDTEGLYGNVSVSVSDIFWDEEANAAYYGSAVKPDVIIVGKISDPMSDSKLRSEFSALEEGGTGGHQDKTGNKENKEPATQTGR